MDAKPNDLRLISRNQGSALHTLSGYTDPHHDWSVRVGYKSVARRYAASPKRLVVRMGLGKLGADCLCHDLNLSLSQAASASVVPDYTVTR